MMETVVENRASFSSVKPMTNDMPRTADELLKRFARYEMPTQFCLVQKGISSIVSFYNYYDQIFPDQKIAVDLYMVFFDGEGREAAMVHKEIPCHGYIQFDAKTVVNDFCGMAGVVAVPKADVDALSAQRLVLRKVISTGYYMTWLDDKGHTDVMHEWAAVSRKPNPNRNKFYVTLDNYSRKIDWGVVLMNHILMKDVSADAHPVLRILDRKGKTLGEKALEPLHGMQTRHVLIREVFPQLQDWFKNDGALGLCVESENLVMPVSTEWHESGDFHFHHF